MPKGALHVIKLTGLHRNNKIQICLPIPTTTTPNQTRRTVRTTTRTIRQVRKL